jgi:egghead protein (zeste-white 4 protein)
MKTILDVGLDNFVMEVVTDKPLNLKKHPRVREVVVPPNYRTKNGSLFKARALQYCLEDSINILNSKDYIVHLDEETIVTENAVKGIINFACEGKHEFGQGLITYANDCIVNYLTTLADCFRVSEDMGKLRFQFKMFHRPLFSWKGSYVVSSYVAEKDVSYDHGIDGSIAEDCYFSMIAYGKGYTFDFISGEMQEKSPFSIKDFIMQRKRWIQGIYLVVHSNNINIINKMFLSMSLYAWMTIPLSTSNILLAEMFPLPTDSLVFFNTAVAFVASISIYLYIFGAAKSFSIQRMGIIKYLMILVGALMSIPFNIVIENIAVIWGLIANKHNFYVVDKNVHKTTHQKIDDQHIV